MNNYRYMLHIHARGWLGDALGTAHSAFGRASPDSRVLHCLPGLHALPLPPSHLPANEGGVPCPPPSPTPTHLNLPLPILQALEAMSKAFKSGGNLDVNSAKVVKLDPVGAKFA